MDVGVGMAWHGIQLEFSSFQFISLALENTN